MSNQFAWTDESVKQFARVYAAGRTGKYKKASKIDDKMSIFKSVGGLAVSSKTPKRGRPSKTLHLDPLAFLSWYFDHEMSKDFFHDYEVASSLLDKGKFSVRLEDIANNCGYIPTNVVSQKQRDLRLDENGDIDTIYYTTFKFVTP